MHQKSKYSFSAFADASRKFLFNKFFPAKAAGFFSGGLFFE
jgi:hypothetical protein